MASTRPHRIDVRVSAEQDAIIHEAAALAGQTVTIRRWEERGLLHAVRLSSGVRRFRPEDIEQVREQMFSGFAPLSADDDVTQVRARPVD